tara:strand:- start:397 stop:597 length:201 start_codon:yes stop_codon:yes gene_type:complete
MKQVIIEETDIENGKEIVIDKQTLNICEKCIGDYIGDEDTVSITDTTYDADCDDCGEFEEGVCHND